MSPRPPTSTFARVGRTQLTFSPAGGAQALVVAAIDAAKASVDVQAYEFSSKPICDAIVRAHARGLNVTAILDKQNKVNPLSKWFNPVGKNSLMPSLIQAGIPTFIDNSPTIAHSKIIVIDGNVVVTGSFNFSAAADTSNTENLLAIHDSKVAAAYGVNFAWRLSLSQPA